MSKRLFFLLLLYSFGLASEQGGNNLKSYEYKIVNGVYCPDCINADSVLKYIEKFRRDEGDSAHYRLGYIDRYYCPVTNENFPQEREICDTLCYFVHKLVPFHEEYKEWFTKKVPYKEWLTKKFPGIWTIEYTQVFCVNGSNMVQRENEPGGDLHFFYLKEKVEPK